MATSLPKFSRAAQKILVAQNLGGLQPPSPPRPVRLWLWKNRTKGSTRDVQEANISQYLLFVSVDNQNEKA